MPFTKEVEGMHPKCRRAYQAWREEKISVKCSNGHLFTVPRKYVFEKCPICGRQVYPAWWFDSARACVNVMSVGSKEVAKAIDGQEINMVGENLFPCHCIIKQLPYLPDTVELIPIEK